MMLQKWLCVCAVLALPSLAMAQAGNVIMGVGTDPYGARLNTGVGPYASLSSSGWIIHGPGFNVISHGPVSLSDQYVNTDQFILQYSTAISMGNSDSRNQNHPFGNLAFVLLPSSANLVMGNDSTDVAVMTSVGSIAGSLGEVRCRRNQSGTSDWEYVDDATGFCFVYAIGVASGNGTSGTGALTLWNNIEVLNFYTLYSDIAIFPPGISFTGYDISHPIAKYMTATPAGDVVTILTAPLGSLTASFGSPAFNGSPATWVKTGDVISAEVSSFAYGIAPVGIAIPGQPDLVLHSYTGNSSVMTSTSITDWHQICMEPPQPPVGGSPPNPCACNPYLFAGGYNITPPGGGPGGGGTGGGGTGGGGTGGVGTGGGGQ
ncbi:MAG: hypothetical protein JNJ77_20765 [Planctomycetia bacterium]|nr:hypothetical protein [Planctomycetia bacterium]